MRAQQRLVLLAATLCALACSGAARRKEKPAPAAQRFSKLAKDADDAIAANRNEEGVKLLDQALELMESAGAGAAEGDLRFNRGAALKKLERFDEALADFQITIRLNPKGSAPAPSRVAAVGSEGRSAGADASAIGSAARLMTQVDPPQLEDALVYYDTCAAPTPPSPLAGQRRDAHAVPLCASTVDLQAAPSSGRRAAKLAKSNCTPAFPNIPAPQPPCPGSPGASAQITTAPIC